MRSQLIAAAPAAPPLSSSHRTLLLGLLAWSCLALLALGCSEPAAWSGQSRPPEPACIEDSAGASICWDHTGTVRVDGEVAGRWMLRGDRWVIGPEAAGVGTSSPAGAIGASGPRVQIYEVCLEGRCVGRPAVATIFQPCVWPNRCRFRA